MNIHICFLVNAHAPMQMSNILSTYPLLLVMTIFVKLVCHQVNRMLITSPTVKMLIPCGMVKVAIQIAHAAYSTIHHGFVNNYHSQLMLIWKSDYMCSAEEASVENTPIELIEIYAK